MCFLFSKLDSSALVLKMQHDKNYIWIDDTEISACLTLKKENVILRWEDFKNDHVSIVFMLIIFSGLSLSLCSTFFAVRKYIQLNETELYN